MSNNKLNMKMSGGYIVNVKSCLDCEKLVDFFINRCKECENKNKYDKWRVKRVRKLESQIEKLRNQIEEVKNLKLVHYN